MSGTRKIKPNGVGAADTRLSVPLPREIDRQLRAYAARRGRPIAPIIREWIAEKLEQGATAEPPPSWVVNSTYSSDPVMLSKAGRVLMLADLPADFIVRHKAPPA